MVELLAPAGSMEALKAAIAGGADAIYVGGSRFNARAYATNFNIEELQKAVKLCHLHGVRLFVTVNTLYKESEIHDLYNYLCELYAIQVDALIVQDEGIMRFIMSHFKNFEIHASTQCSVHNVDGVLHYKNLGLKRVVVARENTIEEIKNMVATGCEIEAFIHGALCVSYSGQCFMSQLIGKRSANRGMCAQPCRLPYELFLNEKSISKKNYLMSCKDLCTIDSISDLIDAGVTSFKIEGRMKRPEYVYAITKAYRMAIDQKEKANINELKQLFNRDFTRGYLFSDQTIISPEFSGNRGILVGKIIGYDRKHQRLKIKNVLPISQGDGIRIGFTENGKTLNKIYFNGKLINRVEANSIFEIDFDEYVKKDTPIYRTTDFELEKQIGKEILKVTRKLPISITLLGSVGNSAIIQMNDGIHHVEFTSSQIIEKAQKTIDIDRIKLQLGKLGQTIYEAKDINVLLDENCFVPITEINELRRKACDALNELRSNQKVRKKQEVLPYKSTPILDKKRAVNYIHCHSKQQLEVIYQQTNNDIIFMDLSDEFISLKEQYPEIGLAIPTICNKTVFKKCDDILNLYPNLFVAVGNVGAYERYKKNVKLLLPSMNLSHSLAHNSYDIPAVLNLDMDSHDEKELISKKVPIITMTYGFIDAMTTKHCVVSFNAYGKKIENCNQCKLGNYHLKDRMNVKFPLMFDDHCIIHILSDKPIKRLPIPYQYIKFTIENDVETKEILRNYRIN